MAIATIMKITWPSPGFANTLAFNGLADNVVSYSKPSVGSEKVQYVGGEEDAWTQNTEFFLEFDIRHIPTNAVSGAFIATGWDDTNGVRDFLESGRDANQFRVYPNVSGSSFVLSRLVSPIDEAPALEGDGKRRFRMVVNNVGVQSYDGF